MKRWISGFLVGVVLASAASAAAATMGGRFYFSPKTILELVDADGAGQLTSAFVSGYAAGVHDSLNASLYYFTVSEKTYADDVKRLTEAANCLKFRGATAASLAEFGKGMFRARTANAADNAALVMIAMACEG
jgi:hypothetical protein